MRPQQIEDRGTRFALRSAAAYIALAFLFSLIGRLLARAL